MQQEENGVEEEMRDCWGDGVQDDTKKNTRNEIVVISNSGN